MDNETRGRVVKKLSEALDLPLNARELVRVCSALISIDRARLAALTAVKPETQKVIYLQATGPTNDTLADFINRLSPDGAADFLNRFGPTLAELTEPESRAE